MMVFSIAMYSAITGVPLFLQTLMGYTSLLSGYATAPRGIAAMIAMPLAGYLMSRVDARWILFFGLAVSGLGTFQLGNVNLAAGMNSVAWPCFVQGVGMSSVFVSLMAMGMGTLRNEQMANGSGIFNLMRNLGGSVGIALTNTFVSRGTQWHYSNSIPHVTVYDPVYRQQRQMLQSGLTPLTGAPRAAHQAQGLLQGIVLQQSAAISYIDIFRWTALMLALLLPCAFLLKKVTTRAGAAAH